MWALNDIEKFSDQELMERIYREFKRLMFSTAKKYVADEMNQEDIVQSSLVKLIKRVSVLRTLKRGPLVCYIVYTVKSVAVDFLRDKYKREEHIVGLWDIDIEEMDSLDGLIVLREPVAQLRSIWELLPEEDQRLLWGKYIAGYTDKELAADFKCKPSSIRMKLTRARRRAFELLSEKEVW